MQQKSLLTISDLANACVRSMKKALGLWIVTHNQVRDKEIIERLEKFLEIKPDNEAIRNQFKNISKAFLDDELNKLAQTFVSYVTNIRSSFHNEVYNYKKSSVLFFLKLSPDIINHHLLFKYFSPSNLLALKLVCKNFYYLVQNYKEWSGEFLKKSSSSAQELTKPTQPVQREIYFSSENKKNGMIEKSSYSMLYIPSLRALLHQAIFLDKSDRKILRIYDFDTQQEMTILKHSASVLKVVSSVTGNHLIVFDENQYIYIWSMPEGDLIETYNYSKDSDTDTLVEEFFRKYSIRESRITNCTLSSTERPAKRGEIQLTVREYIVNGTSDKVLTFVFDERISRCSNFLTRDDSYVFILHQVTFTNNSKAYYLHQFNIQSYKGEVRTLNVPHFLNYGHFNLSRAFLVTPGNRYVIFSEFATTAAQTIVVLYDLKEDKTVWYEFFSQSYLLSRLFFLSSSRIAYITSPNKVENGFLKEATINVLDFSSVLGVKKVGSPFIKWCEEAKLTENEAENKSASNVSNTSTMTTTMTTTATIANVAVTPIVFHRPTLSSSDQTVIAQSTNISESNDNSRIEHRS